MVETSGNRPNEDNLHQFKTEALAGSPGVSCGPVRTDPRTYGELVDAAIPNLHEFDTWALMSNPGCIAKEVERFLEEERGKGNSAL